MIALACLILAIVLIVTPIVADMLVKITKAEVRIDRKLRELETKEAKKGKQDEGTSERADTGVD